MVVNGAPKIPAKESRRGNVIVRWHLRSDTRPSTRKLFVCLAKSLPLPTTYTTSPQTTEPYSLSCKARACTFAKSCALNLVSDRKSTHDHGGSAGRRDSHSYREPSNDRSESPLPCRTLWRMEMHGTRRTDGRGATRTSPASGSALVAGAQYRPSSIISSTHFPPDEETDRAWAWKMGVGQQ